jgi:hypothetical protein
MQGSALAESNLEVGLKNSFFTRAEYVRKSAGDLVLDGVDPERQFDVKSLVLGYIREIASIPGGTIGVGARGSVNLVPGAVGKFYGTNTPKGIDVFLRIRPKPMRDEGGMEGMDMSAPATPLAHPMAMPMQHDSTMKHDSTMTMHHDSTMAMHHDSTMAMHHDSTAVVKTQTVVKKAAVKKTTVKKKKVVPKKKAPAKDPHAGHDMKGMNMNPDTTRRKTP